MSENLIARVGRLISGGVNSIVDAVENAAPEMVLEQAIREIDDATDQVRDELGREIANQHLANTRLAEANKRHEELTAKIEMAVSENRDDLAEAAIARQIDIETQLPVIEAAIADAGEKTRELEGYVSALQAKKREMQDDLKAYRDSRKNDTDSSNGGIGDVAGRNSTENKVRKAEEAFDRVMENQTGMTSGSVTSNRKTAAQIAELEELERNKNIQDRLASFKHKAS